MSITVTESAAAQIRSSVAKFGGVGLKLGIKRVGCSGLAYTFDIANDVAADEHVFEAHEAKVVVAAEALAVLDGSELDYVREGFKQMFSVKNPNAKATCGCGESFTV
jgi:iron-sulfur cluster assembly protein